jgi:DNA-binding MarR family transcriptional regulator
LHREKPYAKLSVAGYIFLEVSYLNTRFGHRLRILHWCVDQVMTNALEEMELTAAQGHIMAYLAHAKEPPCPRDLEAEFQLTHPTVSGLLSRLEQKGFVELRTDPEDRRCKRIYVLPKGQQCHELMHQTIQKNEQRMTEGFTEEERKVFSDLLQRAIRNMGGDPTPRRFKEEDTQ